MRAPSSKKVYKPQAPHNKRLLLRRCIIGWWWDVHTRHSQGFFVQPKKLVLTLVFNNIQEFVASQVFSPFVNPKYNSSPTLCALELILERSLWCVEMDDDLVECRRPGRSIHFSIRKFLPDKLQLLGAQVTNFKRIHKVKQTGQKINPDLVLQPILL